MHHSHFDRWRACERFDRIVRSNGSDLQSLLISEERMPSMLTYSLLAVCALGLGVKWLMLHAAKRKALTRAQLDALLIEKLGPKEEER